MAPPDRSAAIRGAGDVPDIFRALFYVQAWGRRAFLFTSRDNFFAAGGFDEQFFAGEETYQ